MDPLTNTESLAPGAPGGGTNPPSNVAPQSNAAEIAALEKQIAELTAKLNVLKGITADSGDWGPTDKNGWQQNTKTGKWRADPTLSGDQIKYKAQAPKEEDPAVVAKKSASSTQQGVADTNNNGTFAHKAENENEVTMPPLPSFGEPKPPETPSRIPSFLPKEEDPPARMVNGRAVWRRPNTEAPMNTPPPRDPGTALPNAINIRYKEFKALPPAQQNIINRAREQAGLRRMDPVLEYSKGGYVKKANKSIVDAIKQFTLGN